MAEAAPEGGSAPVPSPSQRLPTDSPPSPVPEITVLVVVHQRRQFLEEAVRSAQRQTLARSRYEILVVGPPPAADELSFLREVGAKYIPSTKEGMGGKVFDALPEVRAPLVALLEDDDRFEPTKLETVLSVFRDRPSTIYLHHGLSPISSDGGPYPGRINIRRGLTRWMRSGEITLVADSGTRDTRRLWGIPSGFNCSSVVVRTDLLRTYASELESINLVVDAFVFYVALLSEGDLVFNPTPLTDFRIHGQNATLTLTGGPDGLRASLAGYTERSRQSWLTMLQLARAANREDVARLVEAQIKMEDLMWELRRQGTSRASVLRALVRVAPYLNTLVIVHRLRAVALSFVFVVSPDAGAHVYSRLKSGNY